MGFVRIRLLLGLVVALALTAAAVITAGHGGGEPTPVEASALP